MMYRWLFLWLMFPPFLPLAAAELRVAPFTPGPGNAAVFRKLLGESAETPAGRLERLKPVFAKAKPEKVTLSQLTAKLEGKQVESSRSGTVNSLAFAVPEKRKIQLLVWNSGSKSDDATLTVTDADRFFGTKQVSLHSRILTVQRDLNVTEKRRKIGGSALTFKVPLPPGSAALVELLPGDNTVRVDAEHPLKLQFLQIPGSGHLRFRFTARADSPCEVTLEVRFMQRERFRAVRRFIVAPGKEWRIYQQTYPIPAGTMSAVCTMTGGPAEIHSFEVTE